MSTNLQNKDLRTRAYVLRRTNYGEADRILNLLTPEGKVSVMAKGVRKEKSKLAGNIEMFCLIDINIHQGKSDFGVVTSAKMVKYCANLIKDFTKMELASLFLKKINAASENSDSDEFFAIIDQSFEGLDKNMDPRIVETWFWFSLAKACGEEINLYRDTSGQKLNPEKHYVWDITEAALKEHDNGDIGADEIKIMRLMLTSKLGLIEKIKGLSSKIDPILYISKSVNKI